MADIEFKMSDTLYRIVHGLALTQWLYIPMELPEYEDEIELEEALFIIDSDKIAYVCVIDKIELNDLNAILKKRQKTVFGESKEIICNLFGIENPEFFTIYVAKDSERDWINLLPRPELDLNQIGTFFLFDELIHITQSEKYDHLLLWKFAKSYTELLSQCDIETKGGNLDVFAMYKHNDFNLWPVNIERPDIINFSSELSKKYLKRLKDERNEHEVYFPFNHNKKLVLVYNYCDYAPFYRQVDDTPKDPILLEKFIVPIWFFNDQYDTQHPQLITSQMEMFAFWLLQLSEDLKQDFIIPDNNACLIVKINIGKGFKPEMRPTDIPIELPLQNIDIPIEKKGHVVSITIPIELAAWYSKPDNRCERWVVFNLLKSILLVKRGDKDQKLWKIIDERIPIGIAKMASMLGNANNIQLETRALPPYRKLQKHNISEIQLNLTRTFGIQIKPSDFTSKDSKKKLCVKIAGVLHDHLIKELEKYDSIKLLSVLIGYNEACTQEKAIKQLDRPARIALLGINSNFVFKEFIYDQERTKTALALRSLIELIVAYNMTDGIEMPGGEDIDQLIALMHELISWATLSDGIHFDLFDPKMQLLKCGRIDIDYVSINSTMYSFGLTKTQIDLDQYNKGYENLFNVETQEQFDQDSPIVKEIEEAHFHDLGISFLRLHDFVTDLVNLTRSYNVSVFATDEKTLREELRKTHFNWSESEITCSLKALTLIQNWKISHPPDGYRAKDTKPWYYNRALSFLRRPIAQITKNDRTIYLWGYRHLYAAFDNIYALLLEGILWSPGDGGLSKLNEKYANKKGNEFRAIVHAWLKTNSKYEVRDEEVHIRPRAKLSSSAPLGDIDIFAVDHRQKVIYSLECKNTSESKSIHDFKTDIEQYLESGGYIDKHLNRDKWLKQNSEKLVAYVKDAETYQVVSVIITGFEIPLSYTEMLPIPMISYPRLQLEGIRVLDELLVK